LRLEAHDAGLVITQFVFEAFDGSSPVGESGLPITRLNRAFNFRRSFFEIALTNRLKQLAQ
jgi:hypothetical protein